MVVVGTANTLVDHVAEASLCIPSQVHPDFQEYGGDTRVLAHGALAFCRHAAIGENLSDGVASRWALFSLVGCAECPNIVEWMVVADVLEGISDALNKIVFADCRHDLPLA